MPGDWFSQFHAPDASGEDDYFAQFAQPASAEQFTESRAPEGSALGRFFRNAGEMINPVTLVKSAASAVLHPIDTVEGLARAQYDQGKQAIDLLKQGRYTEAAGHGAAAALPLLGPAAAAAGEQIASGDIAGGLGKGAGLLVPAALGAVVPKTASVPVVPALGAADPAAAEALALAERAGVPLDAATASGNRFVKAAQHVADRTLGGSVVAEKASQAQAERLATLGEQLAAKGYKTPVTAEQAGEAVRTGVHDQIVGNADLANDAYDALRKIEANPAYAQKIPMPDGSVQLMPLPVSIGPVKSAIKPIYEDLLRERELNGVMMGDKGAALKALDTLMKAPDHAPLSVVDAALGDLKSFSRADDPALRTIGQGKVAMAVSKLHAAVDAAASQADPMAQTALNEGRAATTAKYVAAKVMKSLREEPVQTQRALTAPGDTAIEKLRAVAAQAPDTLPQIGRAKIEDLLAMAPDKRFAEWNKLGAETKSLLYQDPAYIKDLDAFMRLSKMVVENPNRSGTAHTALAAGQGGMFLVNPLLAGKVQLTGYAVSKLLHSQAGVRLLTKGLRIPVANKAAAAAWASDVAAATSPSGSRTPQTAPAR